MFLNREDAGRQLAQRLAHYSQRNDVVVLALPRGGVPVAFEIAKKLMVALDVFVVRKIGVPGQKELAMGAIASGGTLVYNNEVIATLGITEREFHKVMVSERSEVERRELEYRGNNLPPQIEGKVVILVDDGIATGSTMLAAVAAIRKLNPSRLVVAAPIATPAVKDKFSQLADETEFVLVAANFQSVGACYEDFSQTTDAEVRNLLQQCQFPQLPDQPQGGLSSSPSA